MKRLFPYAAGKTAEEGPKGARSVRDLYCGDLRDFQFSWKNLRLKYELKKMIRTRGKRECSPLILAGESGSGKTHLAACLAGTLEQQNRKASRMTAERWKEILVRAIRAGVKPEEEFLQIFAGCDLVILDEIEELRGRESTLEELVRLVKLFGRQGIQVILLISGGDAVKGYAADLASACGGKMVSLYPLGPWERVCYGVRIFRMAGEKVPLRRIVSEARRGTIFTFIGFVNNTLSTRYWKRVR